MNDSIKNLPSVKRLPLELTSLYESYGYRQFRMAKFEAYELYSKNENFLDNENIITFTDATGKLMALKPDVTISIVNNLKADEKLKKLFYIENVFRFDKSSKEYREISQIGLEYIGGDSEYSELETMALAIKTLKLISAKYKINVGHMGYIGSFIDTLGLDSLQIKEIMAVIKRKSLHEIEILSNNYGLSAENARTLGSIAAIGGNIKETVATAQALAITPQMKTAAQELKSLSDSLDAIGLSEHIDLDFSVLNDFDYYNGIVFQGYIEELGKVLLAGGRYDNMIKRFKKPQKAIGFALYFGELEGVFGKTHKFDCDIELVYGDALASEVLKEVQALSKGNKSVIACKSLNPTLSAQKVIFLRGLEEKDA